MNAQVNNVIEISQTDIPTVTRSHERRIEYSLEKFGHRRGLTMPTFLSVPGAGKSAMGIALADELSRKYFEERAGNMMPGDMRIPAVDIERQLAMYCGNKSFPFITTGEASQGDRILFVWDEFLDATPIIQKILKQATEANRIGDLVFPDNTLHVAFANGLEHGCNSERLAASSANRSAFYIIRPDVNGFQMWLSAAAISPEAEACVASNIDMFYNIDFAQWDGKSNFASFRTVTEMAMMFETDFVREDAGIRVFDYKQDPLCQAKLNAILGDSAGAKVFAWLQIYDAVGSIEDLLRDPHNSRLPDDLSKQWIVASKLVGYATDDNLAAIMTVAGRLLGPKSFLEAFVGRSISKSKPSLTSHPALAEWMSRDVLDLCGRG